MRQQLQTALAHHEAGRLDAAEKLYRAILSRQPQHARALHLCGLIAHQRGDHARAIELIHAAIASNAQVAEFHGHLGLALQAAGQGRRAIDAFRDALRLEEGRADVWNNLGAALLEQRRDEEAEEALNNALRLQPDSAEAHNNLGTALLNLCRYHEALDAFRHAVQLRPDYAKAGTNIGIALHKLGMREQAAAHLHALLERCPDEAGAWLRLSLCPQTPPQCADAIARIDALLARPSLPPADRVNLLFALGGFLDRTERYARALSAFGAANALARGQAHYAAEKNDSFADRLIATCTAAWLERGAAIGSDATQPLFIVGLSRSGKSLLERLLCAHPAVHGTGELDLIAGQIVPRLLALAPGASYTDSCALLDKTTAEALAQHYLQRLLRRANPHTRYACDTQPGNAFQLGLIALLFPRARVIHCRRDPRDVALAIYGKHYGRGRAYAYDLADIDAYMRTYLRLMEHWRQTLPLPMLEVRYETLLTEPAAVARTLADFLGLDPAPISAAAAAMDFDSTRIGRWRHYPPADAARSP